MTTTKLSEHKASGFSALGDDNPPDVAAFDATHGDEGQDRKNYTDDQDREGYSVTATPAVQAVKPLPPKLDDPYTLAQIMANFDTMREVTELNWCQQFAASVIERGIDALPTAQAQGRTPLELAAPILLEVLKDAKALANRHFPVIKTTPGRERNNMKKTAITIALAALLLGQSAFASSDRWSQKQVVSEQTVNDIIDAIIFVGAGRVAWEIWWRYIDKTPRPQPAK